MLGGANQKTINRKAAVRLGTPIYIYIYIYIYAYIYIYIYRLVHHHRVWFWKK